MCKGIQPTTKTFAYAFMSFFPMTINAQTNESGFKKSSKKRMMAAQTFNLSRG